MSLATPSPIFTSEPMANRALAAEIRHSPTRFSAKVESALNIAPGTLAHLVDVRCEATAANIDILLTYRVDDKEMLVGLEGKLDHSLSPEQLAAELEAVGETGRMVLVLAEEIHKPAFVPDDVPVIAWRDALACFDDPRLTISDIESVPLLKSTVQTLLAAQRVEDLLDTDVWEIDIRNNGNGSPSIVIHSPELPDGRQIVAQVQPRGYWSRMDRKSISYEYFTGITLLDPDDDLPVLVGDADGPPPGWVTHLRTLHDSVLRERLEELGVHTRRYPSGSGERNGVPSLATRTMPFVRAHLNDIRWIAGGYTDWGLGPFSRPVPEDELADLCKHMAAIVTDWYAIAAGR